MRLNLNRPISPGTEDVMSIMPHSPTSEPWFPENPDFTTMGGAFKQDSR
jgi:hypothetical protein